MRFPLRYLATLLMLLAASLLAACGGGDEDEEAARDKMPEGAAATAAATPEEPAAEVAAAPADAFANLESYRIRMRFTSEDQEGHVLAVDLEGAIVGAQRWEARLSGHAGDLPLEEESITIGDQTWVKVGDSWVEGEARIDPIDFLLYLLKDFKPDLMPLLGKETANGVQSLRYSIGRGDIDAPRSLGALVGEDEDLADMPEEFDIDLWLAEDGGWPVRVTMTARGAVADGDEIDLDFSLDVTDVNDPDIKIEPPDV